MRKPNLNTIIENNLDKTKFQSKAQPSLPEDGWLSAYKNGGTYISDRAQATQFGQYKRGGGMFPPYDSWAPPRMQLGGGGCPPGFTKNAFGQCVNASGQNPNQAGASRNIISQAAQPAVVNPHPLATPFKTRSQQVKENTDRANRENYRLGEYSNQASVGQGRTSTLDEERERIRKNNLYASQNSNAAMDAQGNLSTVNPDRTMEGKALPYTPAARFDKGMTNIAEGLEYAGYAEGLGELANLGYGALRNKLGQSMESGWLSKMRNTKSKLQSPTVGTDYIWNHVNNNIRGALPEGLTKQHIADVLEGNLSWIESPEYLRRRMATTGETAEQVTKDVQALKNRFKNTKIKFTDKELTEGTLGTYRANSSNIFPKLNKDIIVIDPNQTLEEIIGTIDHEVGHALSPVLKNEKLYKNYPFLPTEEGDAIRESLKQKPQSFINKIIKGDRSKDYVYLEDPAEQQVRYNRLNAKIREDLNLPRNEGTLTDEQFDQWSDTQRKDKFKSFVDSGYEDVGDLLGSRSNTVDRSKILENLNKAWGIVPAVGVAGALQQKKKGGLIKYQSRDQVLYGGPGPNEPAFQKFFKTLPINLRRDQPDYNIRGYWDALGRPSEFNWSQPKQDDGYYHAFSRNPETGEILKAPFHSTFKHAINEDRKAGYFPIVTPDGKVKTVSGYDLQPGQSVYANGGETDPTKPYHPITNPDGYRPSNQLERIQKLPNKEKPYQPSQAVNNAKAILAGVDLSTGFSSNPFVAGANMLARIANSTGDAYTAARYAMDGQWSNAGVDAGEAIVDLIPFRKGKKVINLSKTNNLPGTYNKLSKLDKSLNNALKVAKAGATADDFMHSTLGKFLFGDPDSQLQYKKGGGYFPEYHSYAPLRQGLQFANGGDISIPDLNRYVNGGFGTTETTTINPQLATIQRLMSDTSFTNEMRNRSVPSDLDPNKNTNFDPNNPPPMDRELQRGMIKNKMVIPVWNFSTNSNKSFNDFLQSNKYKNGGWLNKYIPRAQNGLSFEQITGIKPITSLTNSKESTSLGTKIDEAAIRQASIDRQRQAQGQIRKAEPKRSAASKALAIVTNPVTALSYKVKGQDIPEHFDRGERNAYETAVDIVNPFSYIDQARQVTQDVGQGNYLAAGIGALGLIPGEGSFERGAGKFLHNKKGITLDDFESSINYHLNEGLGIKKKPTNLRVKVRPGNKYPGLDVVETEPKFTIDLYQDGKHSGYVGLDKLNTADYNIPNKKGTIYTKVADYPYAFSNAGENAFKGSGISGELNKAMTNALQEYELGKLYSSTMHTDEGLARWRNLVKKGKAIEVAPKRFELYKVGGFTVTDETTKPKTKCKNGYGCHGDSKDPKGEGIKKVGVRDMPEPQGKIENYVALSNAPVTWEELLTYNETNPKDKDFKNRLKFLQGQFPGLTQNQLLVAGADSARIRQRMTNLPRYDQPSEQTYDRAYHMFYRPLMNQSTPVTIPQILQYQSQQPGGLQGFESTVRGNYGRPKAQNGGNIKLGQNMTVTTEQLEELKRQGYKIEML